MRVVFGLSGGSGHVVISYVRGGFAGEEGASVGDGWNGPPMPLVKYFSSGLATRRECGDSGAGGACRAATRRK